MKREMDLILAILFKIEESPGGFVTGPIAIDGYDDETIGYHLHLMVEGHLLHGTNTTAYGDRTPRGSRLPARRRRLRNAPSFWVSSCRRSSSDS